uniref:GNAT family N-acetyltransferase n=1 Tax=Nonomuraea pusilla TaxID=46177 RepID=UPI000A8E33D4|nr:GNAT family N-acetyltransferase [Nonomuraea pusilla]
MTTAPARSAAGMTDLHLATRNAAALWEALGETRGQEVTRRPGLLGVGGGRNGLRVILLSPEPAPADLALVPELVRAGGRVTVEDPFSAHDFTELRLTPRTLPVMIRRPGPAPAPVPAGLEVTRVTTAAQLETAARVVVEGFPLSHFQPYRPGEVFPTGLLNMPGIELFLAVRDGVTAGACVSVVQDEVSGLYWVTTLPEHRSAGVGRALMHALLARRGDRPVTLTSSTAGKPLYDSLGFEVIGDATWWS